MIISLVAIGYKAPQTSTVANTAPAPTNLAQSNGQTSVDQLLAANMAASMAETVGLPVAGNLRESSTSLYIKSQLAQNDTEIISKPQIVQPEAGGRGIVTYTSKAGDTVQAVASHYGITDQTLRWANNLTSDAIDANKELLVPQVDGVVYTVKDDDTIEKLASHYKADADRIVLYNDLEKRSLTKGMRIVIPGGVLPETERPGYEAPAPAPVYSAPSIASSGPSYGVSYGYSNASVGNRYAFGNCTWYAYERRQEMGRPIGSLWGNAETWTIAARNLGYAVNSTPAPGSIFWERASARNGFYGHVAIVETVDGAGNITIREMNYAGYNVVSSRSISASQIANNGNLFIH